MNGLMSVGFFLCSLALSPLSPQWVGAWWVGILAGMGGFLLVLFPIAAYPKRLPGNCSIRNLTGVNVNKMMGTQLLILHKKNDKYVSF